MDCADADGCGCAEKNVVRDRHAHGMAEPARRLSPRRIELSISEARTRFVQLVRLTGVTRQVTVIVDQGRPIAAIGPADQAPGAQAEGRAPGAQAEERVANPVSAAGWMRRLEAMREDLRRQHHARTTELTKALDEVWQVLDAIRPPGSDRHVDALRAAHADVRRVDDRDRGGA